MSYCCPLQAFTTCYNSKIKYKCLYKMCTHTPIIRVWYFSFMLSFPFFRTLTKPDKLLQNKNEILRKIELGIRRREAFGFYCTKTEFGYPNNFDLMNLFHICGSMILALPFIIFFEEILTIFMIFCLFFNKNFYKKFLNCFHLLPYMPF